MNLFLRLLIVGAGLVTPHTHPALAEVSGIHFTGGTLSSSAFVIGSGTSVKVSTGTRLALDCDLRNSGTFEPANGSVVVLTGYGSPTLSGVDFADLHLALHGVASLATTATVNGWLTLGSGRLSLGGNDLIINLGVVGGSPASYVDTPDTLGRLSLVVDSTSSVSFPIGHSAYNPISVRTGAGVDRFSVAVLDAPPLTGLSPNDALTRAWAVSHTKAAGVNGALTYSVQWNSGEAGPAFDRSLLTSTAARAWRWLDGTWVMQPGVRRTDNGVYPAIDTLVAIDGGLWTLAGTSSLVAVDLPVDSAPTGVTFAAAAPNPMHDKATLRYGLPRRAHVTLALYSVLGERMATLVQAEQDAGWHVHSLDAGRLASGIYVVQLSAGAERRTHKLAVIR